jgi:phosphotransferase system enzyme I (PtsI)
VTEVARDAKKPVALCGEMAGDPRYIPLLIGMGLVDLSMNPASLLEVKKIVRSIEYNRWKQIAKKVLNIPSAKEIGQLLSVEYERIDFPSSEVGRFQEISG